MNAQVYYQDFSDNVNMLIDGVVHFDHEHAVHVADFYTDALIPQQRISECEEIYKKMNQLMVPKGHPDRSLFAKAGHTSMSIGDYVVFWNGNDGEIWFCGPSGWLVRNHYLFTVAPPEGTQWENADDFEPIDLLEYMDRLATDSQ